jgi:Beta galactosidase small chain.
LILKRGEIEVFNKNYFEPLSYVNMVWSLWKDGEKISESNVFKGAKNIVGPREKAVYTIPFNYNELDANSEYFVKVQFLLAKDMPWAKEGYVQMEEQLLVKSPDKFQPLFNVAKGGELNLTETDKENIVSGNNFSVAFSNKTGTINSLVYNGVTILENGNGPKLDAFRAMTDNDNWAYRQWFAKGLHNLQHKVLSAVAYAQKNGSVIISYIIESQAPYSSNIRDLGGSSGKYEITKSKDFTPDDFNLQPIKYGQSTPMDQLN